MLSTTAPNNTKAPSLATASLERNNNMERVTRLELATHSLGSYCSTTELYPQFWWKEQPSKSSCINYSIKRAFLQVLFHQNKKPASQRAFLLRATIPGPPAGSAHAFGQAKSPLIWPLPRTTFSYLIYMVVFASRDKSTISFSKNKRTTTTVKPKPATPLLFMLQLYIIHNCL